MIIVAGIIDDDDDHDICCLPGNGVYSVCMIKCETIRKKKRSCKINTEEEESPLCWLSMMSSK